MSSPSSLVRSAPLSRLFVPVLLITSALCARTARAEQFIVTDVRYTHAKENTTDSHYRIDPLPSAPSNWKSPVDYAAGSVHVVLEVKSKPSDTPTRFQVCFEGTPDAACSEQSPPYTKTGTYEWTSKFSAFWSAKGGPDWSKGGGKVALILKDTNNGKPQGDPKFVPTDLHVTVAVLSANAAFVPPAPSSSDGGVGDVVAKPAPVRPDAGNVVDAAAGAPLPPARDAATSPAESKDAGSATSRNDAGRPGPSAGHDASATTDPADGDDDAGAARGSSDDKQKDSGCSVASSASAGGSWSGGLPVALALALLAISSRRQRSAAALRRRVAAHTGGGLSARAR